MIQEARLRNRILSSGASTDFNAWKARGRKSVQRMVRVYHGENSFLRCANCGYVTAFGKAAASRLREAEC